MSFPYITAESYMGVWGWGCGPLSEIAWGPLEMLSPLSVLIQMVPPGCCAGSEFQPWGKGEKEGSLQTLGRKAALYLFHQILIS